MLTNEALLQIEDALARNGFGLPFAPRLEATYEEQRGRLRSKGIQQYLGMYVVFILICFFCDVEAGIPILGISLTLRLGIGLPIALLSIFLLGRRLPLWAMGLAATAPMMADAALSGILARLVGGTAGDNIMIGPALCIFAQTLIAPVPFRYALRGLVASLTLYVTLCLIAWPGHFHPHITAVAPTFACGVGFAALYERYRRERAERKDFLLSEANRLRIEDILRLNKHLERLSSMDGLTGVFNRRYLDAALSRLWQVAESHQRWIGILMVDIDHFKALNDTAGHQHGDFCLEQVAQILQSSVRAGVDMVARYGGEEFVAILPEADEAEMLLVGERVRRSIEAAGLPAANGAVVTISAGAAAIRCGAAKRPTLEELIATADMALYEAKNSGRNRVIFSTPESQSAQESMAPGLLQSSR